MKPNLLAPKFKNQNSKKVYEKFVLPPFPPPPRII